MQEYSGLKPNNNKHNSNSSNSNKSVNSNKKGNENNPYYAKRPSILLLQHILGVVLRNSLEIHLCHPLKQTLGPITNGK